MSGVHLENQIITRLQEREWREEVTITVNGLDKQSLKMASILFHSRKKNIFNRKGVRLCFFLYSLTLFVALYPLVVGCYLQILTLYALSMG